MSYRFDGPETHRTLKDTFQNGTALVRARLETAVATLKLLAVRSVTQCRSVCYCLSFWMLLCCSSSRITSSKSSTASASAAVMVVVIVVGVVAAQGAEFTAVVVEEVAAVTAFEVIAVAEVLAAASV